MGIVETRIADGVVMVKNINNCIQIEKKRGKDVFAQIV